MVHKYGREFFVSGDAFGSRTNETFRSRFPALFDLDLEKLGFFWAQQLMLDTLDGYD